MQRSTSHGNVVDLSESFCRPAPREVIDWTSAIIPGRLSFETHRNEHDTIERIKSHPRAFYFSSWMHESYEPFCSDFGPVNLAAVVRFCQLLRERMNDPRLADRHVIYYCDADAAHLTNTAFLIGAYLVLVETWTPEQAAEAISSDQPSPFRMFRDATHVPSTFDLSVVDCLRGLQRAVDAGWLNHHDFDVEEYELLDEEESGDIHIICPKFLAFRGPNDNRSNAERWGFDPHDYVPLFKHLQVSAVVRLNEPDTYDPSAFTSQGINHHDMYFDDCTAPSEQLVNDFHAKCNREPGMVAVHCFAGLGRTGTLIATWIMREHGWSAREAMAWVRIVRPGSVIGPQQHFLEHYELRLRGLLSSKACDVNADCGCSFHKGETAPKVLAAQIAAGCRSRGV